MVRTGEDTSSDGVKFVAVIKKLSSSAKSSEDGPIVMTALGFATTLLNSEQLGSLAAMQHEDSGVLVTIAPYQRPLHFDEKKKAT